MPWVFRCPQLAQPGLSKKKIDAKNDLSENSPELCTCHDCPRLKMLNSIGTTHIATTTPAKLQNSALGGGVPDCPRLHFRKPPSSTPGKCRVLASFAFCPRCPRLWADLKSAARSGCATHIDPAVFAYIFFSVSCLKRYGHRVQQNF